MISYVAAWKKIFEPETSSSGCNTHVSRRFSYARAGWGTLIIVGTLCLRTNHIPRFHLCLCIFRLERNHVCPVSGSHSPNVPIKGTNCSSVPCPRLQLIKIQHGHTASGVVGLAATPGHLACIPRCDSFFAVEQNICDHESTRILTPLLLLNVLSSIPAYCFREGTTQTTQTFNPMISASSIRS